MTTPAPRTPVEWLTELLGAPPPGEGKESVVNSQRVVMRDGVLRVIEHESREQEQTKEVFGYKWHQHDTFESPQMLAQVRSWMLERYGNVCEADWWSHYPERPILLDAGCGAGLGAQALFEPMLPRLHYLGVDISTAVEVARDRFASPDISAAFIQADLTKIPLPDRSVDVAFSEGVLHHTDSTHKALAAVAAKLKIGGRILFYVYRRKGPVREFTDDLVRERVRDRSPEDAWAAMRALTELGIRLGELDVEIEISEPIDLLEIPAGRISIQRLFYWHVCKMFYAPAFSFEEMNHVNFDWFAPQNAHRHTPEELRTWCEELGLEIEHEDVQQAGITLIARRL